MARFSVILIAFALILVSVNAEVVNLTSSNFDSIVLDPSKHVFVKFFAPWCGHCKNMAAAWVELSNTVGSDIVIAELDATVERDFATKYQVRGFPTLLLFPKGADKSTVSYSGQRDVKSFMEFLNKKTQ